METLSIALLGQFRVSLGQQHINRFKTSKAKALLAYLAVEHTQPHERGKLAHLFWSEQSEESARNNLRQTLHRLRAALQDRGRSTPVILLSRQTVQFNGHVPHWLDWHEFSSAVQLAPTQAIEPTQARVSGISTEVAEKLSGAVELYRGDFVPALEINSGRGFEAWVHAQRNWAQQAMSRGLSHLATYFGLQGDLPRAYRLSQRQVELNPLSETGYRQAMYWLTLSGRRAEALELFQQCQIQIQQCLNIEVADATQQLYQQIVTGEINRPTPERQQWPTIEPSPRPAKPVSPTFETTRPLLGRAHELTQLERVIGNQETHLLTLHGPPGVGKSTLALALVKQLQSHYPHCIHVSPTPDGNLLAAIAAACRVSATHASIEAVLNRRPTLVLIDACQSSLNERQLLKRLTATTWAMFIVIAEYPLNIAAEYAHGVKPLPQPDNADDAVQTLQANAAIQYFLACAKRQAITIEPLADQLRCVAEICCLVEGNPLCIETAASLLRILPLNELRNKLQQDIALLTDSTPTYHQAHLSLDRLLKGRWQRLSADLQQAAYALYLFQHPFSYDAMMAVAPISFAHLKMLVDQSYVQRLPDGRLHCSQLWRTSAMIDVTAFSVRYSRYYLHLLIEQMNHLCGAEQSIARQVVRTNYAHIARAWQWALASDQFETEMLIEAATTLALYFEIESASAEAERLLTASVKQTAQRPMLQQQLSIWLAWFIFCNGQADVAFARLQTCRAQLQMRVVNAALTAIYTAQYAQIAVAAGDDLIARRVTAEAIEQLEAVEEPWVHCWVYRMIAEVYRHQGNYQSADSYCETAFALLATISDKNWWLTLQLFGLRGRLALAQNKYERAISDYQQCMLIAQIIDDNRQAVYWLQSLGRVALSQQQYQQAHHYFIESLALCQQFHQQQALVIAYEQLGTIAQARGALDEALHYLQRALRESADNHDAQRANKLIWQMNHVLNERRTRLGDAEHATRLELHIFPEAAWTTAYPPHYATDSSRQHAT